MFAKQRKALYLINRTLGKRIALGGYRPSQKKPPNAKKYAASRYQKGISINSLFERISTK
jgi:hypothetical protein